MDKTFYTNLAQKSLSGEMPPKEALLDILLSKDIDLESLLKAAYEVRQKTFGNEVLIHILNNAQNGRCSEDCQYCVQSKNSQTPIEEYSLKSDEEILAEAKEAYEKGAFRYCVVLSGKGPSKDRITRIAETVKKIKSLYEIEVCVSPGIIDEEMAHILKEAGLNRINHNINTSEKFYSQICGTHSYHDRLNTLKAARKVGLQICCGVIIGMGETPNDIIEMVQTLHAMKIESIPINFFIPLKGLSLKAIQTLTPQYCLRVLSLFRFANPQSEIRIAAGREVYLKEKESQAFYPANSLFLNGYLNAKGDEPVRTLKMLKAAGFTIKSEYSLDEIIHRNSEKIPVQNDTTSENHMSRLKDINDLRPFQPRATSNLTES